MKKNSNRLVIALAALCSFVTGGVVSHVFFPRQTGFALSESAKNAPKGAPVIGTASAGRADFLEALEARDLRRMRANFSRLLALSREELARAREVLDSLPAGNMRNALLSEALGLLVRNGEPPAEMMAAARRLPGGTGRAHATLRVLEEWMATDAEGAKDWLRRTPTASFSPLELVRIQRIVEESDGAAGGEFRERLPKGWLAETANEDLLREARGGRFREAAQKALAAEATQREATLHGILQIWAMARPEEAAVFVLELPPDAISERLMETAIFTWALSHSYRAMLWAEALPQGRIRQAAISGALKALARIDQKGAVAAGTLRPEDDVPQRVLEQLWADFAVKNRSLALEWLGSLGDNPRKRRLSALILQAWATQDPGGAGAYAARLSDASEREAAVRSVVDAVMVEQPAQAVSLALSLAPGAVRTALLGEAMAVWAVIDPVSALNWLQGQPSGQERDLLYSSLARSLFEVNPDAALDAVLQISNQQARGALLLELFRDWTREDPRSASAWLDSAPVAAEAKIFLRRNAGLGVAGEPTSPATGPGM